MTERDLETALRRVYLGHNDGRECLCPYCCVLRPGIEVVVPGDLVAAGAEYVAETGEKIKELEEENAALRSSLREYEGRIQALTAEADKAARELHKKGKGHWLKGSK